jgi:hypothetical protein
MLSTPDSVDTYRPAMRGRARAREALRSIGQENLTSPRIPRTASLPLARQRRRRLPDVVGAGMGPGAARRATRGRKQPSRGSAHP